MTVTVYTQGIVGGVGSGKSSLVSAIIGDMERAGGAVAVTGSMALATQVIGLYLAGGLLFYLLIFFMWLAGALDCQWNSQRQYSVWTNL